MTEVVLGIDVGTSGVRIAARDRAGALVAMASAALAAPMGDFGRKLQDPDVWWQAVQRAFHALERQDLDILAIAIDGTSGTIVPINDDGTALGLASMYNDVAEAEYVARLQKIAPPETAALGATSPLARAFAFAGTRIAHQADWLVGKFSGRFDVSDENNALKTGYDPVARRWPDWIAETGFDVKTLPRVVAAGTRIGTITAAAADLLNLSKECAVVAGTTDGCAAFLASGASEPGDGVTSLGTTLTLKLLSATPVFAPEYGIYSHRIGALWLAGGASNTGGGVLGHLFTRDEIVRYTAMIDAKIATGFSYYPLSQVGERFPINDPNFAPRLSPRPEQPHVFFQAVLEGIADVEAIGYQRLGELGASPLNSICSVGGGAANKPWTDIRLQRLNVKSKDPASEHAAMGVARLAWRGIGHND